MVGAKWKALAEEWSTPEKQKKCANHRRSRRKSSIKPKFTIGTISVMCSDRAGRVLWISTEGIVRIAREAGAPKEKGAGVVLHSKLGDTVRKDGALLEIYAERTSKLTSALELAKRLNPIVLSNKPQEKMF
jgi:thymidine phosphorylase